MVPSPSLEEEEAESSSDDAAARDDDESSNDWRRRRRWALLSLLAAFLKLSRVSWSYQSSSLRSSVMVEDGVTVSTTVAVEKATDFWWFAAGGGDTTIDVRRRLRQQLVIWQLSLGVGAAAEVLDLASMLLADEGADGSASALRWKGLAAAQPAIGEIIGEADVKVDDGDRDVLLPPAAATWRNVAALANVCGRRLVFLVTHMLR